MELNEKGIDSQLAIETSGHAAYKENYFLDDGAYLATKIVIKVAQLAKDGDSLDVLISSLKEPVEAVEHRFSIDRTDFGAYGDEVLEKLQQSVVGQWGKEKGATLVQPNYEGVRINFDNEKVKGWCLLRKSLHDPQMPLNIEVTKGSCGHIMDYVLDFMKDYGDIK
jgi:phosphomannomutase